MDGFQTDDEDEDGTDSDKEMGIDIEDGEEADSTKLTKLAEQVSEYDYEDLKTIWMHILIKKMLSLSFCLQ